MSTNFAACPLLPPVMACPSCPTPPPATACPLVSTMKTGMPGVGVKPTPCRMAQQAASAHTHTLRSVSHHVGFVGFAVTC